MKESVKAARVHLSLNALRILYTAERPMPVSEIFSQYRSTSDVERTEATSPRSRKWQTAVMNALANDGIVEEMDDETYSVKDGQKLAAVLGNAEQDGVLLSNYVFGRHQVEMPVPDIVPESGAGDVFMTLLDQISKNHATFDETLGTLLLNSHEILDFFSKADERAAQLNKSTNKRIDALEERVAGVQRVAEAMQATAKSSLAALTELTSRLSTIGEVADTLSSTVDATREATRKLKEAATLLLRSETDDLGKLMRALRAHAEEGQALHESCLELLAERK